MYIFAKTYSYKKGFLIFISVQKLILKFVHPLFIWILFIMSYDKDKH